MRFGEHLLLELLSVSLMFKKIDLGGIQYLRKQVEVGGWLVNCLRL